MNARPLMPLMKGKENTHSVSGLDRGLKGLVCTPVPGICYIFPFPHTPSLKHLLVKSSVDISQLNITRLLQGGGLV